MMPFVKFRAVLATARIANVPSVVSNVWLGVALATLDGGLESLEITGTEVVFLTLAGALLYISGNFLNDWMDHEWDAQNRPERALPLRLFSPDQYARVAGICAVLALLCTSWVSLLSTFVAAAILASICIYTFCHKRSPWSVIPMATCRALLPVLGYSAFSSNSASVLAASAGLFCYIMGLSLNARYESIAAPPKFAILMARSLFVMTAILSVSAGSALPYFPLLSLLGVIPYGLWMLLCLTKRRQPISRFVSSLLAGIPLVDWMVLLPISLSLAISGAGISGDLIGCLVIPPLAWISAIFLQKLAPAT